MDKVALADFIARWQEKTSKIQQSSLDTDAVRGIKADFDINELEMKMVLTTEEIESGAMQKLQLLRSKLHAALESASSRFQSENLTVFNRTENAFNGMFEEVHQ